MKNNLGVFLMLTMGLASCACLQPKEALSQKTKNIEIACQQSDVLVTDLTDTSSCRKYLLPTGEVCPITECYGRLSHAL